MWEACLHCPALSKHMNSSGQRSSNPFHSCSSFLNQHARHKNGSVQSAWQA